MSSNRVADPVQYSSLKSETFPPNKNSSSNSPFQSNQDYERAIRRAQTEPEAFWKEMAETHLKWDRPFRETLQWTPPFAKWFLGGELNASVQCLDRHHGTPVWKKTALIWESEQGDVLKFTYEELSMLTNQAAGALKQLGVKSGDLVTIYMPLIPEVVATMLACARVGATHSVVFAGFSSEALKDRIQDAKSTLVVTSDGAFRKGQTLDLKAAVDKAVDQCPTVKNVLVVRRAGNSVKMKLSRDHWWHELVFSQAKSFTPVPRDSEDLLFTLYTSGTTGKPKGIMHSHAGYLLWAKLTTHWIFDLNPTDIYWCTADVGWITGHTYFVYGPLQNGATCFFYEGAPNTPDWGRFWKMIQNHQVTILYTAPTAIRAFMGQGSDIPVQYDLSSLRVLGSVGEPINPEAWRWYHKYIGREKCPIVDTWWQTETGGIMISPLANITTQKPGSCSRPLPGIEAKVVSKDRMEVQPGEPGFLVVTKPWPSMLRGIYGDPERFKKTYWSDFEGMYFTGDGSRVDQDGYFWVMGRVDDVINVSGHRLGTAEIESALVSHPMVVEAAVVGRPDPLKGQAVVAFVTLEASQAAKNFDPIQVGSELKDHVVREIGALARPEEIRLTQSLPKTRSGKIMRRLLREIATKGVATGDTTTLEDEMVLQKLMMQQNTEED